ncbi:MAG TPA: Ig-like domain-containing protein [Gemmatimonadales bacterium]|nr:Ig-like domain-containing protein [Gemmatimonadales bacterium]
MRYLRLAVLVMALASCSDDLNTGPDDPGRILVAPSIVILEQGDSVKLVVRVLDAEQHQITDVHLTFSAEDPAVIDVSAQGLVRASGVSGATHVIVTADRLGTYQVPVTVVAVGMTLELTPDSTIMGQRDSLQLTARVIDRVGNEILGAAISFFSSNGYIGVSSTGLVTTAGGYGTATISAFAAGGLSAEATVVVTQTPTSIQVQPGRFVVGASDTAQLGAQVLDWGGVPISGAAINYSSSNPGLVTVDPTGLLTASASLGSTTMVLTSDTLTRIVDVSVVPRILPQATANMSGQPYGAAISPSGVIYVVTLSGTVERATVGTFNFATVIQALGNSRVVAFNAAGDQAYVTGEPLAGVTYIDVAADSVTEYSFVPGIPFDLAVGPDGTIYLSTNSTLYSFDPLTHFLISSTSTQSSGHLAVHPSQPLLYLSAQQSGVVLEFNSATLAFVRQFIGAGNPLQDVVVSPDGNTLYITDEGSGLIAAVDLVSGQTSYLDAGCTGWSLLINPAGTRLYIGCPLQGKINLLDLGSGQIVGTLRIAQPRHMAISPDGLSVVIPSQDGQVVLLQ